MKVKLTEEVIIEIIVIGMIFDTIKTILIIIIIIFVVVVHLGVKLAPSAQVQVTSFPDPHGFDSLKFCQLRKFANTWGFLDFVHE